MTRTVTDTAWGGFQHDTDLLAVAMKRTVRSLRTEIRERLAGDPMRWSAFWRMPKAHLAAIVAEWATFERQNDREATARENQKG